MRKIVLFLLPLFLLSCKEDSEETTTPKETDSFSEMEELDFRVLDSENIDATFLWMPFSEALNEFSEKRYAAIHPKVMERTIPQIQKAIQDGEFTYEELTLFYLTRMQKYDRENALSLNSIISLNPDVLAAAKKCDSILQSGKAIPSPLFGIPVLLKDNINTKEIPTTAGALALLDNHTEDAFIVKQLKNNGALVLGKTNLSEWAYFFCMDCPSGYSAVGGQTFNPYGRKYFDTGGSSSGSAVAVAANFAPVAVGTETSGSILSPSSQNSVVGLKPTVGLLSRGGIVPISGTLDTPGPIAKSAIDNAILLAAMTGADTLDAASKSNGGKPKNYQEQLPENALQGKRFGALKPLMKDSLYVEAISVLKERGAKVVVYSPEETQLPGFLEFLSLEMKRDLPAYFKEYGNKYLPFSGVEDIVAFNSEDSLSRIPYGQELFDAILKEKASANELTAITDSLKQQGLRFLEGPIREHELDGILSINNQHAGFAAVAHYPAITVPMGYTEKGKPQGLTIIAKPFEEAFLLACALDYEKHAQKRKPPKNYTD